MDQAAPELDADLAWVAVGPALLHRVDHRRLGEALLPLEEGDGQAGGGDGTFSPRHEPEAPRRSAAIGRPAQATVMRASPSATASDAMAAGPLTREPSAAPRAVQGTSSPRPAPATATDSVGQRRRTTAVFTPATARPALAWPIAAATRTVRPVLGATWRRGSAQRPAPCASIRTPWDPRMAAPRTAGPTSVGQGCAARAVTKRSTAPRATTASRMTASASTVPQQPAAPAPAASLRPVAARTPAAPTTLAPARIRTAPPAPGPRPARALGAPPPVRRRRARPQATTNAAAATGAVAGALPRVPLSPRAPSPCSESASGCC